jgi:hypothetical protein
MCHVTSRRLSIYHTPSDQNSNYQKNYQKTKKYVSSKNSQKFVWGLPDGIYGFDPKLWIKDWNTKSTNQIKITNKNKNKNYI